MRNGGGFVSASKYQNIIHIENVSGTYAYEHKQ